MRGFNDKKSYHTPKFNLMLRVFAGIYLLYLSFQLFRDLPSMQGTEVPIGLVCGVAFAIFGAALAGFGGYALYTGRYEGGAMDHSDEEEALEMTIPEPEQEAEDTSFNVTKEEEV